MATIADKFILSPESRRRKISSGLDVFIKKNNYLPLLELGIRVTEVDASGDCGMYLCRSLGLPQDSRAFSFIGQLPKVDNPSPGNAILYRDNSGNYTHGALYLGEEMARSWWGESSDKTGPVVTHDVRDIPFGLGSTIDFRHVEPSVVGQYLQARHFRTDDGY